MNDNKIIYVYYDSDEKIYVGNMYVNFIKGYEQFSFEYSDEFFKSKLANYFFDADISNYAGRQFLPSHKHIFGVFSDSAPDRWGRLLMKRKETIIANKEDRKPKKLYENDYLLGVYDEARMGALRFSLQKNGDFLSNEKEFSTPPFESLRTLEEASREFENDKNLLNDKWLKQLLAPGSSLGGARPKATIKDIDGSLWLAKFPSKNDEYDVGAWEKTAEDLARLCNLNVVETKSIKFSKLGSTFLSKRFDRNKEKRIHFISAMTALGKIDGANAQDCTSYLDIASFIKANSASPTNDLKELFKRIIFNISISNTDDHLRNHGFILLNDGWHLSPLYDVNPNIDGTYLALNIDYNSNLLSYKTAISVSKYFNITKNEAEQIVLSIKDTVKNNWKTLANKNGISKSEIEYMKPAFCYKE